MVLTPSTLLWRLNYVLLGMLFTTAAAVAQPTQPPTMVRNNLVTALNAFIGAGVSGPFSFADGSLYLDDALDGCGVENPLGLDISFTTDEFTITRVVRDAESMSGGGFDNQLAADLNAWVNAVWGLDLKGIPIFDAYGFQCMNGVTPSPNRFYTEETMDGNAVDAIAELTGENYILNSYYLIQGELVKGSDFISFEEPGGPRVVRYMTDRGDPALDPEARDTIRYLGNAYIRIDLTAWGGEEFTFLFKIQTTPYHTTPPNPNDEPNCGISQQITEPGIWSGYNNLDTEIRTYLGPPTSYISNSHCRFGWLAIDPDSVDISWGYKTDPDEASEMTFNYIRDHSGEWTYNPYGEGGTNRIRQLGRFIINSQGELVFSTYWSDCCAFWEGEIGLVNDTIEYDDELCITTYCRGGEFFLDPDYQTLLYEPPVTCPDCSVQPVPCIVFCDSALPVMAVEEQVIRADARSFTDRSLLVDEAEFAALVPSVSPLPWIGRNDFERGIRGKWRSTDEYAYRTSILPGSGQFGPVSSTPFSGLTERNYNDAGIFDLTLFNWRILSINDPVTWLAQSHVERFSQNGEAVEEHDLFDIPSTAHFAYDEQLPILVAKNATYNSVCFEAFEDGKGNTDEVAHSGNNSLWVKADDWGDTGPFAPPVICTFTVDQKAVTDRLLFRFWARQFYFPDHTAVTNDPPIDLRFSWAGGSVDIPASSMTFIAKTGEWSLYEAELSTLTAGEIDKVVTITAKSVHTIPPDPTVDDDWIVVWLDDFRMQPMASEMVCYVYYPDDLRQATVFDDQHFGIYFQYNGEGKLIRKLYETERGLKAVQEAQYHTPVVDRNYASSTVVYAEGTVPGADPPSSSINASENSRGKGTEFDLLNIELGMERQNLKVLGLDADQLDEKLGEIKELLKRPSLSALNLPDLEKLRLIDELAQIEEERARLESIDKSELKDQAQQKAWDASVKEIAHRRTDLLNQLGLSETEAQEIVDKAKELKNDAP